MAAGIVVVAVLVDGLAAVEASPGIKELPSATVKGASNSMQDRGRLRLDFDP